MRLLLLAGLLAAGPALAQADLPLLTPSHQDLAIDALTFEDQTFEVRTGPPANQSIGTITQTVAEDGEYVTVVTEVDIPQFQQATTDSVRLLRASLAPQMASLTGDGDRSAVRFDALRAIGTYGTTGRELPIDVALKTPAFHNGSSSVSGGVALVARAMPFEEGYEGVIETFSPRQRLKETTLTVTGREDAERLDGTTVSAWVVREVTPGRQTVTRRYYVDPRDARPPPGGLGRARFRGRGSPRRPGGAGGRRRRPRRDPACPPWRRRSRSGPDPDRRAGLDAQPCPADVAARRRDADAARDARRGRPGRSRS